MPVQIDFDPAKRVANFEKHEIDLAHAGEVFVGRTYTLADDRFDYGEERFVTVGYLAGRMVVIVWTPRDGCRRVISMRKANDREQAAYADRI